MKQYIKKFIFPFIKEMLPVIAGILIALFIDNWNENRKDNQYINQAFLSIHSELDETKKNINEIIPLQKLLIDSLDFYTDDKKIDIADILLKKSKGIHIATIKTNAWKTLSNSKIELIDYKKVTTLTDIEEQKDILKTKSDYLGQFVYSNLNETDKNKKEVLKIILLDIIQTEKTTLSYIEYFEKK
ncbi:hypothetical protein HX001_14765 [Empedobacter brevis]|uniref:Uncharacterized protein n=2 Tax=Empedobacter brevis TaxID=247 RepID=A0A511NGI7_9FLAO|nr:hypothetical protein [Empedobacter brevis]MDM1073749.1 hypothetical protein [Empedobacter brevis]QES93219.1 hypothetical protein F0358_11105 [Empedobacter brevis]QHC85047.1 hypothetical protein AS589_09800 [Empedobacter brevis]GEM51767.1 hypothetical protein EB1_15570 [Empedobacter brevis NBRC 14943 = ATCC 43319]